MDLAQMRPRSPVTNNCGHLSQQSQRIRAGHGTIRQGRLPVGGRSLTLGRSEGMTKVLSDETPGRGIVGPLAGRPHLRGGAGHRDGADAGGIGLTIHPHPTLSETVAMATEAFQGTITDLYLPRRS